MPDTAVKSYFLTTFGRPERQQSRESERSSVPTITQALDIINGETLNNKLRAPASSIAMLMRLGFSDEQIVDYLYLASLSRHPSDAERANSASLHLILQNTNENPMRDDARRTALIDMSWALLTGEEFMFDH